MSESSEFYLNLEYSPLNWKFHQYSINPKFNKNAVINNVKKAQKEEQKTSVDWIKVLFLLFLVLTVQLILAVGSYSGEAKPPMFGDYEAQRHWMEITYNLPVEQWYVNNTDNDLLYWGLDYPPLTAFHSYFMGFIAHHIDPSWVALHSSRGITNTNHKMYMRVTAILPFYIIYFPSLLYFALKIVRSKDMSLVCNVYHQGILFSLLLYPGLISIDNSHFQYNSISLGLFVLSFCLFCRNNLIIGSITFVMAINYKQMELYHALPVFTFVLARCLKRPLLNNFAHSFATLFRVSSVVVLTFTVLWLPFILHGYDQVKYVLMRLFPFYRGLYEDKVASVWCAFSSVFKMSNYFNIGTQIKISTLCVCIVSLPSLLILFLHPSEKNFRYSLFTTSLTFFLFSFQVHEKSVLLPAMAALLLLPDFPFMMLWFLHISNTSLFSLCLKDGNGLLLGLFIVYYIVSSLIIVNPSWKVSLLAYCSCLAALLICIAECCITPPIKLPHIFPLLNAFYSCCHFLLFLGFFNFLMIYEAYQKWSKKIV